MDTDLKEIEAWLNFSLLKKKESYVFHPMLRMSIPIIEKYLI